MLTKKKKVVKLKFCAFYFGKSADSLKIVHIRFWIYIEWLLINGHLYSSNLEAFLEISGILWGNIESNRY